MDCPTITMQSGKCYKDLIDWGAAISHIWHFTYQLIDDSFKTPIQLTTTKLNAADRSPVKALGMTTLHLRIADFKFTHNFIICNRLPDTEVIFGIDIQKKFSVSYAWDREKNCYIQNDSRFLTYTRNCEQKAKTGIVKSTLKIPPRNNGVISIKIKGHTIRGYMAYFISNQDSTNEEDPNINIINGTQNIKGKTFANIPISNYTNKHITLNKGEYVGCLEPTIEDIEERKNTHCHANPDSQTMHSITTQWMMGKQVKLDTFKPPCHKLKQHIEAKLGGLLEEYASQFAQDEMSIGTPPLTEIMIDTRTFEPVSQKPYPIVMIHYHWFKDEIEKPLTAKVILGGDQVGQHPSKEMEENTWSLTYVHSIKSQEISSGPC